MKQGAWQTPGNLAPSDGTKGEVGQKLLALELERREWMSFSSCIEEKVDLVAASGSANGRLRHAYIQVETGTLRMRNNFQFNLRASKLVESRDFYCVLVRLKGARFHSADFYIAPSLDLRNAVAKCFESPTWEKHGSFNFACD
ncbi:MAG: hypothetical protein JRN46_07675 [Nitrososphaerota archaeon]|nr:hypothetical protein [Nitrososphaerota archaeon]